MELDAQWLFDSIAQVSFYALEKNERAIAAATRALTYGPPDNLNIEILVLAYANLGQFDDAIAVTETYTAFLNAEDQSYGTRNELAWGLFQEGNLEPAQALMAQWIAAGGPNTGEPDAVIAHSWDTIGHIRAARGDAEGALTAFVTSLEYDTEDTAEWRRETYRGAMEYLSIAVARVLTAWRNVPEWKRSAACRSKVTRS